MKSIPGGKIDIQPLQILVVDDSESDYNELKSLFSRLHSSKHELYRASSEKEGLKELSNKSYDVCLLDHSVDSKGGLSFLEQAQKQCPHIPIILLSEGLSIDSDIKALRLGAADYLNKKHLQPGFLHRAIRYALERRRSRNQVIEIEKQILYTQKMRALGQLAASMAHDLNEALGVVLGHLDLINYSSECGKEIKHSVSIATEGCERAISIIDHILAYSSQETILSSNIDLQTLIPETIEVLSKLVKPGIKIMLESAIKKECKINGNKSQIRQALINLAMNSNEALTNKGTITISVDQIDVTEPTTYNSLAPLGKYAVVSVLDSGCGIAEEHLDKVLDPSFSTKNDGQGLGLGLPVVKSVMENHHGWIEISSPSDSSGTLVKLFFPQTIVARSQKEQDLKNSASKTKSKKSNRSKTKGLILVIEDEENLGELITLYLAAAGYESKLFTDPGQAIEWYQQNSTKVLLIILDFILPDISGENCFGELRACEPDAKIAICSDTFNSEIQGLLDKGALKFFQKPNRYPTLVTWISEVLG